MTILPATGTGILLILMGTAQVRAADSPAREDLEATIKYLTDYVAKSDCTFIRNGEAHTGQEAAEHMAAKYEHFKNEIKTPEDFIRLAATKSLMSGKPYMVKTKDGKEMTCEAWLGNVLKDYRDSQKKEKSKN